MRHKDIKIGMTVYYSYFVHWGKGIVQSIRCYIRGNKGKSYSVDWENQGTKICRVSQLRKTPNKKKQQNLNDIKIYREFLQRMRDRQKYA